MNKRTINIGLHIIIWILFLSLPFLLSPYVLERFKTESCHRFYYTTISVLLVLHYYFNYYFATPRFYFKQKYVVFIGLNILFVIAVFLFVKFVSLLVGPCPGPDVDAT